MNNPTPPPPSETKLSEALLEIDRLWAEEVLAALRSRDPARKIPEVAGAIVGIRQRISDLFRNLQKDCDEWKRIAGQWEWETSLRDKQILEASAARSSLESLYGEQSEKLQAIEDVAESYVNTDDGDHANWVSIMGGMIEETRKCMDEARMEASALRSLQLTPLQAEVCLIGLRQFEEMPTDDPLLEKLQRISSKATSEEL